MSLIIVKILLAVKVCVVVSFFGILVADTRGKTDVVVESYIIIVKTKKLI